jgi:ribonuclease G
MADELFIDDGPLGMRLAVARGGRLVELGVAAAGEAPDPQGTIWLGRVAKVAPAINAAFVDVGLERAGFLRANDAAVLNAPPTEGQAILVQARRPGADGKGIGLTADIAIPGRFLTLTPMRPGEGFANNAAAGSAAAGGAGESTLAAEREGLLAQWRGIQAAQRTASPPAALWREPPLLERFLRDRAQPGVRAIHVNTAAALQRARAWLAAHAPEMADALAPHRGPELLFDRHGLEDQADGVLAPRVTLPSGAVIRFGATAALTAIDVDTGAATAAGNPVSLALAINLEAAAEIARQLRLRAIGGLIVIDFLRLADAAHQNRVLAAFRAALADDPAAVRLLGFSPLGLVEMTRQRQGEPLAARLGEPCSPCGGAGLQARAWVVAGQVLRQAERQAGTPGGGAALGVRIGVPSTPGRRVTIACAPDVAAIIEVHGAALGRRLGRAVTISAEPARARADFTVVLE